MTAPDPALAEIVRRCAAGAVSPPCAIMELLIALEDDAAVARVVADAVAAAGAAPPAALAEMARLVGENAAGCARIGAMLRSGLDTSEPAATVDDGIAFARRLFDWGVQQSEEASVALYSLGSAALLAEATAEIVEAIDGFGLLAPHRTALEIGCGIGRFVAALAPRLAAVSGIDIAPNMIEAARRRCVGLANVHLAVSSGRDLAGFGDGALDLVLAVDSFPYVVQAGLPLVDAYFAEVARVLRPGGDFALLGFSYRGDDARDRDDVARASDAHGLRVVVAGARPFRIWNGAAFVMQRP